MSEIGERLHELREARALTQSEVAARAGVTPSAVYFIETGRTKEPAAATVAAIAQAIGVSIEEVFKSPKGGEVPVAAWVFRAAGDDPKEWADSAPLPMIEDAIRSINVEFQSVARKTGDPRTGRAYPPSPEVSRAWARIRELAAMREVIRREYDRRRPPPVATVTEFAPSKNKKPVVRWHTQDEAQIEAARRELEERFLDGFEEKNEPASKVEVLQAAVSE